GTRIEPKACVPPENPYKAPIPLIGRELNGRPPLTGRQDPCGPASRVSAFRAIEPFRRARRAWRQKTDRTEERHSMPLYEHVYLARQDVSAQQVEDLTKQFTTVIEGLGGKVLKNEYWGVKSLNFRIRKKRKAHFTLLNVDAPPAALAEVERQQRINEDVLRYLTVRVDELEEGPSAMMRKVERDRERDERGGGRFGDREGGGRFGGGGGDRFGGDRGDRPPRRDRDDDRGDRRPTE